MASEIDRPTRMRSVRVGSFLFTITIVVATLPLTPLHALEPRVPAACFALLAEKQSKSTRDGQPFLVLTFKDRKRRVTSTVWSDSPLFKICRDDWAAGGYYRLQGVLLEHEKYGLQFELRDGRDVKPSDQANGFDERDFVTRSRFDSQAMFDELISFVRKELANEPVKALVISLLTTHADVIKQLPASLHRYHTSPGGWLEHTLNVCKTCLWLADFYIRQQPDLQPPLNRDLILAAAALHEIGRVAEWSITQPDLPPEPTIPGRIHGSLILARDLIRDASKAIPEINSEFVFLLEHVILSYLTLPEWGSPRLPAIPEVLILHHADDLDAKFEMYARCLINDPSPGPFTERDPILNKPLLKARSV